MCFPPLSLSALQLLSFLQLFGRLSWIEGFLIQRCALITMQTYIFKIQFPNYPCCRSSASGAGGVLWKGFHVQRSEGPVILNSFIKKERKICVCWFRWERLFLVIQGKKGQEVLHFWEDCWRTAAVWFFFKGPPMKVQMNKGPASGALHGWMALKIDV